MPAETGAAPDDEKLCLVDVGGAGGIQQKWRNHAARISPVLFEPNPAEAAKLRAGLIADFGAGLVLEIGLSDISGTRPLNIARYFGCTSLLQPNPAVLSKYRIAPLFDITHTVPVACTRYDELYRNGEVPAPDAIKIDVQGFEYEVLQGFGTLLQNCLSIELETHIYPIYQEQKLLHHLVALLAPFGFVLRALHPVSSFDGDVVELDAWFTKDISAWNQFTPRQRQKFSLICEVCNLVDYRRIDPRAGHNQISPA
jgi:FkbM family methyltransferase